MQLCVLPEIGGRIFSGLDKTNGYDFVYRQHVIKPALIGMLGAWISGGVEWDIPHHHRPSTFMPVDCIWPSPTPTAARRSGSARSERRHRMKWVVGLTLHPDRSYLEVTIRLFNRTPYAHSFLCFTNLAVHVNEDYQVIFPPGTRVRARSTPSASSSAGPSPTGSMAASTTRRRGCLLVEEPPQPAVDLRLEQPGGLLRRL